jgi:hypothetical protein
MNVAIPIILALAVVACTSPSASLTSEETSRLVRYALTASSLAGRSNQQIIAHIVDRTGWSEDDVRSRLRRIKGRIDRDPDSLTAESVGVIVATADALRVRDAVVDGLCSPLVDEGDAPALTTCTARQRFEGMRLCRVSNGAHVAFGAIMPLTSWQSVRVRDAVAALSPAPQVTVVRDSTLAAYNAALAANVPPLRRCNEGE